MSRWLAKYRRFGDISSQRQSQARKPYRCRKKFYSSFLNGLAQSATVGDGFGQKIAYRSPINIIFIAQNSIVAPPEGFQVTSFAGKKF